MELLRRTISDLLHLVYPEQCLCCGKELSNSEQQFCFICHNELHYTNFEHYQEASVVDQLFWGRLNLENVFSLLYYKENSQSRKILHHLKYGDRPDLATAMGEIIGEHIVDHKNFEDIDVLIPVPIHRKKRYIRGYNQSEEIAKGIQNKSAIPVDFNFVSKDVFHESQTKKNKFQRWDNVQNTFYVQDQLHDSVKHIAIVDDVLTTGSTIETLIHAIQAKHSIKLSVITIAYAG